MFSLVDSGYGDSDDDREEEEQQEARRERTASPAQETKVDGTRKKRRKRSKRVLQSRIAAVLPPEILDLLESGGIDEDEDFEGPTGDAMEGAPAHPKRQCINQTARASVESHGLFKLLPNPAEGFGMSRGTALADSPELRAGYPGDGPARSPVHTLDQLEHGASTYTFKAATDGQDDKVRDNGFGTGPRSFFTLQHLDQTQSESPLQSQHSPPAFLHSTGCPLSLI